MPENPAKELLEQSIKLLLEQIKTCEGQKEQIEAEKGRVYPWTIGGLIVGFLGTYLVSVTSADPVLPFIPPVLFGAIGVALGYSRQVEENAPRLTLLDQEISRLQDAIDAHVQTIQST